jgi:hypothetical protein
MNRLLLLSSLLIWLVRPLHAQTLDQDKGMFGYTLGSEASEFKDLLPDGKKEKLQRKRPVVDSLKHEGIPAQKVRVYFFEGKLHSIDVKLQGDHADRMLAWVKGQYGEGIPEDAMGFKFRWEGKDVTLFWDQNLVTHDAMMTWRSEPVHKQYFKLMQSLY